MAEGKEPKGLRDLMEENAKLGDSRQEDREQNEAIFKEYQDHGTEVKGVPEDADWVANFNDLAIYRLRSTKRLVGVRKVLEFKPRKKDE